MIFVGCQSLKCYWIWILVLRIVIRLDIQIILALLILTYPFLHSRSNDRYLIDQAVQAAVTEAREEAKEEIRVAYDEALSISSTALSQALSAAAEQHELDKQHALEVAAHQVITEITLTSFSSL